MNTIRFVSNPMPAAESFPCPNNYWLLVYCTEGTGIISLSDGFSVEYSEGTIAVIPQNFSYTIIPGEGYADIQILLETPSFHFTSAIVIPDNPQRYLLASFEQARQYFWSQSPNSAYLLDSLGSVISNYIVALNQNATYTEPISKICDTILHNYSHCDFALDEFIREMPFHYDYLRKRFKQEVGMTPREYLSQLRMEKARTLLSSPGCKPFTICEIARQCGFDNPLYFSTMFKRHHGVSPSQYIDACQSRSPQSVT